MRLLVSFLLLTAGTVAFATDLVAPMRSGNQTELERIGDQTGAAGLAPELVSGDRVRTLAGIQAARGAKDGWALLGILADKAADPDRSIAVLAAQIAAETAHDLSPYSIELLEIPGQDLRYWHAAWLKVALEKRRWVDIRVYALESAETLRRLIPQTKRPATPWPEFFSDKDEEMRSAAIALAPREKQLEAEALLLLREESPSVALSAAQWLCTPLGSSSYEPITLEAALVTRLQEIATNQSLDIASRADLANCLIAEGSAESRKAIALLLQQSRPPLRQALAALMQAPAAAPQ